MTNARTLLEKIEALPPEGRDEVEDFVEFVGAKIRRLAAIDRFLAVAPALEAARASAITEDEIQAEVEAVRTNRQGFSGVAHRS